MISSLEKFNTNTNKTNYQYITYKTDTLNKNSESSSFKKLNPLLVSDSNKQTFATTFVNTDENESLYSKTMNEKTQKNNQITCLDLLDFINTKRKNQITIPLKKGRIKKENLINSVDLLKDKIGIISSDVTKVKNSETDLNTLNKKTDSIRKIEFVLGKEYLKEIESNKQNYNEMNEKINELDNETLNSNDIYNKLKKEVCVKKNNCKELSNAINQLIEDKKELNTLLIIYQKKIKKMKENIYNRDMLDNRIKSGLKTIIANIDM